MRLIALLEQKFREVRPVLPSHPGYECNFRQMLASLDVSLSVAFDEAMRIAIEMLGGELVKLRVLQRLHLMHQARRNIHAFPRIQDELLDFLRIRRGLDSDPQAPRAQEK